MKDEERRMKKKGIERQNIGGGNMVGRRVERGGGGVVISWECKTGMNDVRNNQIK